ncbi:MAG: zinc-binding dehydrogenase, partial [Candidatus Nanopelagicales bacterium]
LGTFICAVNAEDLSVITNLIESGTVNPVVDQIYPLSHAPTAIADLLAGQVRGKLAISVGDHESHSRN